MPRGKLLLGSKDSVKISTSARRRCSLSERTARMSAVARDLYFVSSGILAELAAVLFISCYGALACWMRTLGLLFGLLNSHRFTLPKQLYGAHRLAFRGEARPRRLGG